MATKADLAKHPLFEGAPVDWMVLTSVEELQSWVDLYERQQHEKAQERAARRSHLSVVRERKG